MSAIVHYRANTAAQQQISSSFTVYADGYITVPITFLLKQTTPGSNDNLLAGAGRQLTTANVKNLPANRGLFIRESEMFYENGLAYARVQCSSCLALQQFEVSADTQTVSFSLSREEIVGVGENAETVTRYTSFLARIPTITAKTSYRYDQQFSYGAVSVSGGPIWAGSGVNGRISVNFGSFAKTYVIEISNIVGDQDLGAYERIWRLVETVSEENDGNIVRAQITYTLDLTERPD